MRTIGAAAAVGLLLLASPSRAGNASGAFAPYEDVIEVMATIAWHLDDDTYRFPRPQDPTGHDLFGLSLERLDAWRTRFPNRLPDVVGFARAQALERLREYGKARDAYEAVGETSSPLAGPARDAAAHLEPFAEAAAMPEGEPGDPLEERLAAVRAKLQAWAALVERHEGTPHASLAMIEEERLERLGVHLVTENRHHLDDGAGTAERAFLFLIKKHADSKHLPRHLLDLGDLYAALAREYADDHERPLAFAEDEFTRRADRALETYQKVATWDGAPERPEAEGRFAALESYKRTILARHR